MSRAEGFAAVPNWMIREKRVPRNAILVYASLSSRAGMGAIFPSQATIAEESGLSERTVRRMMGHLEELGVIERRARRGGEGRANSKTDAYTLHPNGRAEGSANLSGRSERPDTEGRATGQELQCAPLIEVDREEVDRASCSFDDFWAVWPRKDSKKTAQSAWAKAIKKTDPNVIVEAARAYAQSPYRPERQFVPYGASWLNAERWNDPLPEPAQGRGGHLSLGPNDRLLAGMEMGARLQAQYDAQRGALR
ncbi:helix-turn-helix domain-containing protein [Microbacterium resistens]|uniref:Helix-turn-helix domain-containing protein n=1 Tax=Microbacterium resistens TaxID=156977 RepID=A0ABY3RXH6_9MICO|nr:helix-turn-helix domain-containing protein [Microbacterium resistens]UGS27604.1 helix-turn-helix domain-containing protein [Microbacterium resistens]